MAIRRDQKYRLEAKNPVDRHYRSDRPEGMDVAREGYSVVDRTDPRFRSSEDDPAIARDVNDGARDYYREEKYGSFNGVG
jgi:hypothetical protein